MDRDTKIRNISSIILVGFIISIFYHYFMGFYLNLPYPYNTFLFTPVDRFADFFVLYDLMQFREPYIGIHLSAQYPLLNVISFGFRILPRGASLVLYLVMFLFALIIFTALYTYRGKYKEHISEICNISLLTYPVLFTIDRGNLEGLVLISLLAFVYCYQTKKYLLSVFFLSIAIAMKLFPVFLVVLYLSDRKYKEIILTGLFTVLITIISLFFFLGGFFENLTVLVGGANLVHLNRFLTDGIMVQRGISIFTLLKIFFIETNLLQYINIGEFLGIYIKIAMIVFLFFAAYVVFLEKEFWKKVAILVIAMLILPQVSADYKLIHIFIPLFLFINSSKQSRLDWTYLIMFGLLLIPKDYYILPKVLSDGGADISVSVIINILILMIMPIVIMYTGVNNWISMKKVDKKLRAA